MTRRFVVLVLAWGVLARVSAADAAVAEDPVLESVQPAGDVNNSARMMGLEGADDVPFWRDPDRWSFQAGVGFITSSTIDEVLTGGAEIATGDAGGEIYLLQASLKLGAFEPRLLGSPVELDIELPLVLGLVDEQGSDLFGQYSGGVTVRWKTFPWNHWLKTNFETGVGLTYSEHVLAVQRERHPGRYRSHLEFYWPIQFTFALPRYPRHQLVLFNHHHSGGHVFHEGGSNTLGFGYRLLLGRQ